VNPASQEFLDYLNDILDNARRLKSFVKGMAFEAFQADIKTQYAVIRALEVIGEATKRLPAEVRDRYPEIPWRRMAGMRDVLIHQYEGISARVLYATATRQIDVVIDHLPSIIAEFSNDT
jgi:uncharacterized protein with HEPN domain